MKIGIDMDNTICSTNERIDFYQKKFIKEENITINQLWDNNYYKTKFLNLYLEKIYNEAIIKNNAPLYINKLKEQGNKIYIITARTNNYVSNIYNIIENYCKKNNIKIDGIFINTKNKVETCLKNNIDIMIEDSKYNYGKLIEKNINTILFDENNKQLNIINKASSWKEVYEVINYTYKNK